MSEHASATEWKQLYAFLENDGMSVQMCINGAIVDLHQWPCCGVDEVTVAQGIMFYHTRIGTFAYDGVSISHI